MIKLYDENASILAPLPADTLKAGLTIGQVFIIAAIRTLTHHLRDSYYTNDFTRK